jgi:hypothetical protein
MVNSDFFRWKADGGLAGSRYHHKFASVPEGAALKKNTALMKSGSANFWNKIFQFIFWIVEDVAITVQ